MPMNLALDTASFNPRLEDLLVQQAAIQAEIESLLPASAPPATYSSIQHHRSPIHKQHRNRIHRSMSSSGTNMTWNLSSDRNSHDTTHRLPRTLSQRSAPMSRTDSRGISSAHSGNMSFSPGMHYSYSTSQQNPSTAETWDRQDQPANSYTFSHQARMPPRSISHHRSDLELVHELDIGENPADYLSRTGAPMLALTPSPVSIPTDDTFDSQSLTGSYATFSAAPATPCSGSLTTATTLTSNMSRQNSMCNDAVIGGFQMMSVNSNASFSTENYVEESTYPITYSALSQQSRHCSNDEQSQLLVGAGGVSNDSQFSQSLPTHIGTHFQSISPVGGMKRSESNESTSSSASTSATASASSRSKQRLQAQIAAARKIAPKGGLDDKLVVGGTSQSMSRLDSKDGSLNKLAISKRAYQRPKHERVYCKQCDEYPDGFRGEHELRRHQDRQHKDMVKKWICVEPPSSPDHPQPLLPLSKCKACHQQKKKYGAYYNAAAHLRRAHFRPKPKGRNRSNKADEAAEKRGGKAGGDWPSMQELKRWMQEVEERATDYSQVDDDSSEDESNECDVEDIVASQSQNVDLSTVPSYDSNSYFLQSANIDINNQMTLQSQSQDMNMDTSLSMNLNYSLSSSQNDNGFDSSFPVMTNSHDSLAFFENSSYIPLSFDDQPDREGFVGLSSYM
ncbi:hypothetical protein F5884DRAFT_660352 [Xylogone sp. PMI_703]|nr:hypothetical protein F5884DRAFT_660352 [Xylogone sp. PMI_703]